MNRISVLALLPLFAVAAHSFPWEIVMAAGKRLKFYNKGVLMHTEYIPSSKEIYSVTYDPVQFRVLFIDHYNTDMSICSFELTTRKIQTLITRQTRASNRNLAYDPLTQLLFWNENENIYWMSLKPASSNTAAVGNLLFTLEKVCTALAVDTCGGYIYWTTENKIERAAFDGSEREILMYNKIEIRNLAIDQQTLKMYWTEIKMNNFSLESADLNGKNSRTFYLIGREIGATSLTLSKDYIYWRSYDKSAILQLPKNQQNGVAPTVYLESTRRLWVHKLIAANYTIKEQASGMKSCEALKSLISSSSAEKSSDVSLDGSSCRNYCFQGNCSISADGQPTCSCEAGYAGERCEVNVCYKHCLHGGVCSLNEEEQPVCQCTADHDGERCEVSANRDSCVSAEGQLNSRSSAGSSGERNVNACHQYCLNDGVCSLNEVSEPVCQCTGDYEGDRCDVPAFLIKFFLYAYENIPPATPCRGVSSTCDSTVV